MPPVAPSFAPYHRPRLVSCRRRLSGGVAGCSSRSRNRCRCGLRFLSQSVEEDALVFEAAPQPLDEDVVHPAPASVHGNTDADVLQRRRESESGELAALIGIEDVGLAVAGDSLFKSGDVEVGIQRVR